ncbi:MAG: hypothetical protein V3W34_01530, partial [Phycisphaerae bacterium]
GTGVGVTVGGVPPRRDLPTATFVQPFRLHQGTALKPPIVSRTLAGGGTLYGLDEMVHPA